MIQDEVFPDLSIYTLQPDTPITKDMDHDTVLATDVVRLLVDSQVSNLFTLGHVLNYRYAIIIELPISGRA